MFVSLGTLSGTANRMAANGCVACVRRMEMATEGTHFRANDRIWSADNPHGRPPPHAHAKCNSTNINCICVYGHKIPSKLSTGLHVGHIAPSTFSMRLSRLHWLPTGKSHRRHRKTTTTATKHRARTRALSPRRCQCEPVACYLEHNGRFEGFGAQVALVHALHMHLSNVRRQCIGVRRQFVAVRTLDRLLHVP